MNSSLLDQLPISLFSAFEKIWTLTLFSVDKRPITVANLVIGIALFILGYWISKWVTHIVTQRALRPFELNISQEARVKRLVFYTTICFTTLFALNIANVPLTIFTLLGGALAIGIGFGSQNVVNNFISGIIIMIESPIKVGDIIEIEGLRGVVEQIGARSTRIRSYTNTHVIVPNSWFLEKNFINWTLADDIVLISAKVGVAYGSPTDEVRRLLREALKSEPKALAHPEPVILFNEFGDNALHFEIIFGVRMKNHMERMKIESNIRFNIDDLFRKADITIAFPQRDVHLSSPRPLDIRLHSDRPSTETS